MPGPRAARPAGLLRRIVLVVALAMPAAAAGHEVRCERGAVRVTADDPLDAATACRGASAAVDFLARHGVDATAAVDVRVVAELPAPMPSTVLACCSAQGDRVYLLDFAAYAKRHGFLVPLPPDRAFHAAVAAHEIAHALVISVTRSGRLGIVAHEYIAFVAMLDSLPLADRARLLALYPSNGSEIETMRGIDLVLMVDPMRFGVAAYRHFGGQLDPAAFLQRVLTGAALAE